MEDKDGVVETTDTIALPQSGTPPEVAVASMVREAAEKMVKLAQESGINGWHLSVVTPPDSAQDVEKLVVLMVIFGDHAALGPIAFPFAWAPALKLTIDGMLEAQDRQRAALLKAIPVGGPQ